MKINMTKTVPVQAKTLKLCLKVRDQFSATVHDQDGEELGGQDEGYVPGFMPEENNGDYVMLDIDLDSGRITNWTTPEAHEIEVFINGTEDW